MLLILNYLFLHFPIFPTFSYISLYSCMFLSSCYSFHVFPHIFGYYNYNFCFITLPAPAFIIRYIFHYYCFKRKYFPMTDTDSPPRLSVSPIPLRWDMKKHFYLSYLLSGLPPLWGLRMPQFLAKIVNFNHWLWLKFSYHLEYSFCFKCP